MIEKHLLAYRHRETELEAAVAWDSSVAGPRPAVLVAHMWGGRVPFCVDQAVAMARLGYLGFALDLYGKGVFGASKEENERLMTPFLQDRGLLQDRMWAAFDTAAAMGEVDAGKIAAIGFCFGGLCVLDLAFTHPSLVAAVSFHGLLSPPANVSPAAIGARVMLLHGHADPLVSDDQLRATLDRLDEGRSDWQLIAFGHARHAFTNPEANDPDFGAVYDARADRRAWRYASDFLAESFALADHAS